jgi:RNA polymerase sigma factor (sigma-70 family)
MLLDNLHGDADFWNLWENNKKLLLKKCIRLMNGNICEAEDALSTAMLKAREKMFHYRDRVRNFKGWALRLTENVCLDHLRKHKRLISLDDIPESLIHIEDSHGCFFMESTESYNSREDILKEIFEMVDNLPQRLREPALLRFLYFKPYHDIAGRLHITEENARKRIQEARSVLKLHYGIEINGLLALPPGETGMEPESPAMKKMTDDARPVLEEVGFELDFSCVSAWIVKALPITGIDEDILVFLPFKPGTYAKGFESSLNYISKHSGGWKKHLELAQILYAAGIWDQSEKMLRHVLKKHPRSFSAWILLGNMLSKSGRTDQAEELFRQAGSHVYRDSSRHYLSGMVAECRGDLNEAIALFERAESLEPSNLSFRHAKGICLFRLGQHADAQQLFESILAQNPGDIVSLAYCCELSLSLNRRKNAGEYLDSILKNNPHDFFGLTRKAGLNGQKGIKEKEEQMRLQQITERFNQLAILMKEIKNEKIHTLPSPNVFKSESR